MACGTSRSTLKDQGAGAAFGQAADEGPGGAVTEVSWQVCHRDPAGSHVPGIIGERDLADSGDRPGAQVCRQRELD
jgi:hypothetical protein